MLLGVVCAVVGVVLTLRPFASLDALVRLVAGAFFATAASELLSSPIRCLAGRVQQPAEHDSGATRGAAARRALHAGIPKEWRAWRILYTTTRDENVPAVASGLVIASEISHPGRDRRSPGLTVRPASLASARPRCCSPAGTRTSSRA